ncbi:hypothetical protein F9U64_20585 [Gracilibacillus oryzae]|uniref:GerMN domain-containing protein n=1 Tax=Gracilibacillus oryzae TaxID=1672701 RepID=A0A7C8GQN8_9BACI|nr:hypothetical protein [Gracilibacillus oryzae]KAB8126157.1 hypothetical protein F9U64_20585 [Gracilibacillus oryzae]
MKKMAVIAGIISIAFFLVACQSSESEEQNSEPVKENPADENALNEKDEPEIDEESENKEDTEESADEMNDNDSAAYSEIQETPAYFIDTHVISTDVDFHTAFSITRDEEQQLSLEDRLEKSLKENDPSQQGILSSYADISVEWPELHLQFNEEGSQLSTTSTQSLLFNESLFGISDLYGIEEVTFFNPDGETDIIVAERKIEEPVLVENERGLTRGYYTVYDKELQSTLFLPGGELDEQVTNENGEPLSFPETVESMKKADNEGAFYSSAIVEGIEIENASLENGNATVQYTMDEEMVTESDRIVFENAMQLAALDFHASEILVINDTLKERVTYPLVDQ